MNARAKAPDERKNWGKEDGSGRREGEGRGVESCMNRVKEKTFVTSGENVYI